MTSQRRRVVVTGMGAVTALGVDVASLWDGAMAGRSGIRRVRAFDVTDYKSANGAEVDDDALGEALRSKKLTTSDRTVDMALVASAQALEQAGLVSCDAAPAPRELPVIFGSGIGASRSLHQATMAYAEKGIRGPRPTTVPRCMANAITAQISMRYRLTGPNYVIVSACTSSTTAIGTVFRMVRDGAVEAGLCGGADTVFDPFVYAAWNNLGVMSKQADPTTCCRPFDAARDGCVLGEGAGALVLESLDSARARGAAILAELSGFGESSDAEHITSPSADGQARAMRAALASAGIGADDVGFVNAHGTATRANDACESRSIRMVLGGATDRVFVASNKAYVGHLLGASGAVESILTIRGLQEGRMPASLNLDTPDPACDLRFVGKEPLEYAGEFAMKNSFGFGGNNGVLVWRRWTGA